MKALSIRILLALVQIYRKIPLLGGKGIWRLKSWLRRNDFAGEQVIIKRRGMKWVINSFNNDAAISLAFDEKYDFNVEKAIMKFVKVGSVAMDIGSNIGIFSIILSQKVGKNGWVLSYEPSIYHAETLKANIAINAINNIKVFEFALGKTEGKVVHYTTESSGSIVSDYSEIGMKLIDKREVDIHTLDKHLTTINLETPVSFIKIDVDGNELGVLQGAKATILRDRPVIVFELAKPALKVSDQSSLEILRYLEELDYYFLDASDKPAAIEHIHNSFEKGDKSVIDIIALPVALEKTQQ